jgi:ABC-type lipoprotein export system ATPase subunit
MRFPFFNKTPSSPEPTHYLDIRNLRKVYNTPAGEFIALENLSVKIDSGNFIAVIGRSGSGKSTFINCLTGIDRPTSGEIFIDGVAVHSLSELQLARWRGKRIGLVFQFFQLLPTLSLAENVMLPMELNNTYPQNMRRKRAMELLDMVGLVEHSHKLPSDTSGGQQQRVAIARSLANDPAVIICDEPTGNLDAGNAHAMFNLFEDLRDEGKTIVMVTHDDELAQRADHVFLIEDGVLVNEYLSNLLDELTEEQFNEFIKHAHITDYDLNSSIIEEGSIGDEFFIVLEGSVNVYLQRRHREVMVGQKTKGGFFGEMALLGDGRRTASVRTGSSGGAKLASINRATFQQLIEVSRSFRQHMEKIFNSHKLHNEMSTEQIEIPEL